MSDLFSNTLALVTGASSGLGEEFARQLAARKANLVLTARSEGKLRALADSLTRAHGVDAQVIALDLGAPGGAERLADALAARGLEIDHLISNAGFGSFGAVVKSDPARQAEMVRLNCEAVVTLTARLLPKMVARGRGGVIHVASIAGFQPAPFMATYAASKAFVLTFSEAVSEELRGTGVRAMALCPGPVPTGFQAVTGAEIAPAQKRAILSAEVTVERGLRAYERGVATFVPGGLNKLGTVGVRFVPRSTVTRVVGKIMRGKGRA
jgi:short-subunit dehydrogenase